MKLRWVEADSKEEYDSGFERNGKVYALQIYLEDDQYWDTILIKERYSEDEEL